MRVLIVEDDEGIAGGLEFHLRHLGWVISLPTFFRGERADRARNPGLNPVMVA